MKTHAWGWLAAAVLAAGLNASYHDGGLHWAHQVANRVTYNAGTVIALATGDIDQLQSEARVLTARNEVASCPLANALARVKSDWQGTESGQQNFFGMSEKNLEVMSAREEAQLARLAAHRARIEAQIARVRIPAVAFNPVAAREICPRMRMNLRVPMVRIPPMPTTNIETPHVDLSGAGAV